MLDLSHIPVRQAASTLFPSFSGRTVIGNRNHWRQFSDFFVIGDASAPARVMNYQQFQIGACREASRCRATAAKTAAKWPLKYRVYVLHFMRKRPTTLRAEADHNSHLLDDPSKQRPERVLKQLCNSTTASQTDAKSILISRLCTTAKPGSASRIDRVCRFCQPGRRVLPVRERSAEDLLRLSKKRGQQRPSEYSMLSLCVRDYTILHE